MIGYFQIPVETALQAQATRLAELSQCSIEEILAVFMRLAQPTFTHQLYLDRPVAALSDVDIIAIADLQLLPELAAKYSDLLQANQNAALSEQDEFELNMLQHIYEIGLLYKSEALAESVKRGLRPPLEP